MVCTEISPDITNPGNTEFTFGGSLESLADETNRRLQDLNEHINSSVRKASDLASTALNVSNVVKRENTMLDNRIDSTNAELESSKKIIDYEYGFIHFRGFQYDTLLNTTYIGEYFSFEPNESLGDNGFTIPIILKNPKNVIIVIIISVKYPA